MKKTFNINLAGFAFTIDEDAYSLLHDYLNTIEHAFSKEEDSKEISLDIEARVAELLMEKTTSGSPIVTIRDVEEVIERVGKPEEMIEEDSISLSSEDGETVNFRKEERIITPPPYIPPVKKKLFRDPQNSMLGGVCSGLAHYMNLDPTVVRLATVLLTVLSVSTVAIVYIVLWIVVPEARTPLERMQMLGEAPTMENIARTVTDNYKEENGTAPQPGGSGFGANLASFFGVCAKILIIIGLIIGIPILIGLGLGLLGCLFALIIFCTGMGEVMFGGTVPEWYAEAGNIPVWGVLCGIGWILVLAIPLYVLVMLGIKKNKAHFSKSTRLTMIVVWILGFILAGISAGRIVSLSEEQDIHGTLNKVMTDQKNVISETTDSIEFVDTVAITNENKIEITSEGIHIQNDSVSINIGR